ncbi:MAG: hypothetical protein QW666_01990 [Candidatus Woesearchaeota archaeon]
MKRILALCLLLVILIGCQKAAEKAYVKEEVAATPEEPKITAPLSNEIAEQKIEQQIEAETGEEADVEIDKGDMTIKTEQGTVEVTGVEGISEGDWCKEGAEWKFTSSETAAKDVSAKWIIKGMGTGEFSGLCHVVYTMQTTEGTTDMDYYFAKDGKSGYAVVKLPTGQTFKQEWHG